MTLKIDGLIGLDNHSRERVKRWMY